MAGVLHADHRSVEREHHRHRAVQRTSSCAPVNAPSRCRRRPIQNIAVNGRSFFGLAALVPGVVPNSDSPTQVSNLNANGQRSNSNNMTIDGVANIDTGDNGGNMAQTNLDAIAEFKILTASYQAEYGRAVGAQVQVVTKCGSQHFSGSGYWYARRSDWNANTWINNALEHGDRQERTERLRRHPRRPGLHPWPDGLEQQEAVLLLEPRTSAPAGPRGRNPRHGADGPRTRRRLLAERRLQRQPVSRTSATTSRPGQSGVGLQRDATSAACFADGGVLGKIPANRLYAPTLKALSLWPTANTHGPGGLQLQEPDAQQEPAGPVDGPLGLPDNNNWRFTGRLMWHANKSELPYGISGWSVRTNVDTINVISDVPGRNWVFSTTGILNNTTSLEVSVGSGHNSLSHTVSNDGFTRTGSGMSNLPVLYTSAIQEDLLPAMSFGGGRIGNPVSLEHRPGAVHELQHDLRRGRQPDQGPRPSRRQGRPLLPAQPEAAERLHELQRQLRLLEQRQQPVRRAERVRERRAGHLQHVQPGERPTSSRTGCTTTSKATSRTTGG